MNRGLEIYGPQQPVLEARAVPFGVVELHRSFLQLFRDLQGDRRSDP